MEDKFLISTIYPTSAPLNSAINAAKAAVKNSPGSKVGVWKLVGVVTYVEPEYKAIE